MSKEILNLEPAAVWKYFHDLTQIPRPTHHTEAVRQYLVNFGNQHGLETHEDNTGNVLIRKPASAGYENAPVVILQSHVDMVPQANSHVKHDFLNDPIEAYIDGERVTAKETTLGADNGIGVAAILAVLADPSLKHGAIEGLFTVDEEEGMDGAFGLEPGFLKGEILLNLDTEDEGELCVGCAGGADINAVFQFRDEPNEDPEDPAFKISLSGLRGGHSGCEIHLYRANANKLLFRFLKEAVRDYEVRLSHVDGGSLRNAIPREAFAIVTVPEELVDDLHDLVASYEDLFNEEYKEIENQISFKITKVESPKTLIPEEIQDNLINAVEACQNGVVSMLSSFPGVVETSSNLARVISSEEKIELRFLARSSSESRKDYIVSSIESVFALAGAKVVEENGYPGWQPDIHSKTLKVMGEIFEELFHRKAEVKVVHAGLECGIILDSTPGLDIVSFGPTIVSPHSPDEYVVIETVPRFYHFLVTTLERLK
jgi:dipeptidase D